MKKLFINFLFFIVMIFTLTGCGESKKVVEYNPVLVGDMFQQNVKGNIVEGCQWKYEIKNNHITYYDEMVNFYDLDSKTEIGDFFYFFNAISEGDDEIVFKLFDTNENKVYCEIKYVIKVDTDKNINLLKRELQDNRGEKFKEYTYDEPEVRFQGNEH